jgi:hypothetical protein
VNGIVSNGGYGPTFTVGTPPNVAYTNPSSGPAGTSVTITGSYFGATQGSSTVTFNGTVATPTSWSDTSIVAPVPSSATTGAVKVTVNGIVSNGGYGPTFTVGTPPNVSYTSPGSGTVGSSVTIVGQYFGTTQGSSTITFNGTVATPTSWSDTSIVAPVPSSATTGAVKVTVNGIVSNGGYGPTFTVVTPPAITSLSPTSGPAATSVTITGTNLGATQGSSTVTFNGTIASPTSWSNTSIVVPVPTGAATGNVVVTVSGLVSNGASFTVISGPHIASLLPASGPTGSQVTITGTGFGANQGSGFLLLGTNNGLVTTWSDTQIVALVSTGSASGVAQVTQAGIASNTLNFAVTTPAINSATPTSGAPGTQVTVAGSNFGAVQGNGQVLLGTVYGTVVSWSDSQVVATVAPGSASGRAQVIQGIASNYVSFNVTAPVISSVSPASGAAGTQVTIAGSGFGATQGNGKVLLGTAAGVVVSWSDTQVAATVATGSSSGYAQITQGNPSNALGFSVAVPTITGVSPASGISGTQVTISGSGFGAAQANGNVWLGSAYGTVVSWGDTQVVATVAAGSASGTAQILQNGVWSNSIPFSTGIPQVTSVTPNSGTSGTQVTFTGSGFASTQGSGIVWLGSASGSVVSWSDTQVVATVASGAMTGIARIQQNAVWSNSTRFVVPTVGSGNAVILVPQLMNMLVGRTRSIQALDSHGAAVKGLTWTSSNTAIASLSTDDPPIITALASGHVTITAGDASADLTVYSGALPVGSVVWSVPGDGSGVVNFLPAVPSYTGVADVFAVQASGYVQAITDDGSVAWTANVGNAYNNLLPDFLGGLVESTSASIIKFDGLTGQQTSHYAFANPGRHPIALHTDGMIFSIDGDSVIGIDPQTGIAKFSIALEHSTNDYADPGYQEICQVPPILHSDSPPVFGSIAIAGDGYLYVPYFYTNDSSTGNPCLGETFSNSSHTRMLRLSSTGTAQKIILGNSSDRGSSAQIANNTFLSTESVQGLTLGVQYQSMITNADTGIVFTWTGTAPAYCALSVTTYSGTQGSGCVPAVSQSGLMAISGSGVTSQTAAPGFYTVGLDLQGADGTFYGPTASGSLTAFDQSGNVKWAMPNYSPAELTADGGLIAQSTSGQFTTFDQNGVATGLLANPPSNSWFGSSYAISRDSSLTSSNFPRQVRAGSFAAVPFGNDSGNGTPIQQVITNQPQSFVKQLPELGSGPEFGNINMVEFQTDKSPDYIFQTYLQTFAPVHGSAQDANPRNSIMFFTNSPTSPGPDNINVTGPNQILSVTLRGILAPHLQPTFSVATERFDPVNHVISVVTLQGHPLAGWRYWRVYSIGTNDVVIETGAYDTPGPGNKNFVGYFLGQGTISRSWREFMEYIRAQPDMNTSPGFFHPVIYVGSQGPVPVQTLLNGLWDYTGVYTDYLLNNVCLAPPGAGSCN